MFNVDRNDTLFIIVPFSGAQTSAFAPGSDVVVKADGVVVEAVGVQERGSGEAEAVFYRVPAGSSITITTSGDYANCNLSSLSYGFGPDVDPSTGDVPLSYHQPILALAPIVSVKLYFSDL
ncbi:MAG: hypothetical protein IIZ96_02115 [Oscillospiraceae bacterium]|nr:hypothetical protein [Oscillospiraceae bacterium]